MITLGQAKFTAFGKLATAVALSAAFCSAHAQNANDQASNAAIADGVSKAVSLAARATALNPVGPILSIGSEHERRFWERCAILREFAEQPDFPCVYTPPEQDDSVEARSTLVNWSAIEAP